MKKILFLLTCLISLSAFSQKNSVVNDKNAEKREVKNFRSIKVSGGIDLYLSGGAEAVAVSAKNIQFRDRIKTSVEDGVLKIWYDNTNKNESSSGDKKLRAYVSYKQLDVLTASSGSDVHVDGNISGEQFSLHISGGSGFEGSVALKDLKIDQSSGSDIKIQGIANTVSIEANSGSDFKGYKLISDVCNVDISSGSDVEITVNKELWGKATGASKINYKGSGTVKQSTTSGAGSISHKS